MVDNPSARRSVGVGVNGASRVVVDPVGRTSCDGAGGVVHGPGESGVAEIRKPLLVFLNSFGCF